LTAVPGGHHPCGPIEHGAEVIPLAQLGFAGCDAHPHGQFQFALRDYGGIHRCPW
jgi:hypothetical protein